MYTFWHPTSPPAVLPLHHQMPAEVNLMTFNSASKDLISFVNTLLYCMRRNLTCPHLPRYTVFTGSTARAVATRSSALCLRPLTMSSPSIFPTTKIRLPWERPGETFIILRAHRPSETDKEFPRESNLLGRQNPRAPTAQKESLRWELRWRWLVSPVQRTRRIRRT